MQTDSDLDGMVLYHSLMKLQVKWKDKLTSLTKEILRETILLGSDTTTRKCVQRKFDIAGTVIEMHLLLL